MLVHKIIKRIYDELMADLAVMNSLWKVSLLNKYFSEIKLPQNKFLIFNNFHYQNTLKNVLMFFYESETWYHEIIIKVIKEEREGEKERERGKVRINK